MDQSSAQSVRVAIRLMRMALALLHKADEALGAARLQHAIDTVEAAPPPEWVTFADQRLADEVDALSRARPNLPERD